MSRRLENIPGGPSVAASGNSVFLKSTGTGLLEASKAGRIPRYELRCRRKATAPILLEVFGSRRL